MLSSTGWRAARLGVLVMALCAGPVFGDPTILVDDESTANKGFSANFDYVFPQSGRIPPVLLHEKPVAQSIESYLENYARKGFAWQSNENGDYPAHRAIDGDETTFSLTGIPPVGHREEPFLQVDLGKMEKIEKIVVKGVSQGVSIAQEDAASSYYVLISESKHFNSSVTYNVLKTSGLYKQFVPGTTLNSWVGVEVQPYFGRYVFVGQLRQGPMLIGELEVWGPESCEIMCMNHGKLDQHKCDCTCMNGFDGPMCEACPLQCYNGGTLDPTTCTCRCASPWGASDCTVCQITCEDGTRKINKETCACECEHGWTGQGCNDCNLECQNGSERIDYACDCKCKDFWRGRQCNECIKLCRNGGRLNREECRCDCLNPWAGPQCMECPLCCENNGILDDDSCTCRCPFPWSGPLCADCNLDCGLYELDRKKCECNCDNIPGQAEQPVLEDGEEKPKLTGHDCRNTQCHVQCLHGGMANLKDCTCTCANGWGGDDCEICTRECSANGVLNPLSCTCTCLQPWDGETCSVCNLKCGDRSMLNMEACACDCRHPWSGQECTECKLDCKNGSVMDKCQCMCHGDWGGEECAECQLSALKCGPGGSVNQKGCICSCKAPWTGWHCQKCGLNCLNNSILDAVKCKCACEEGWTGLSCQVCARTCHGNSNLNPSTCECLCKPPYEGSGCIVNEAAAFSIQEYFEPQALYIKVVVKGLEANPASFEPFSGQFVPDPWIIALAQALSISPTRLWIRDVTTPPAVTDTLFNIRMEIVETKSAVGWDSAKSIFETLVQYVDAGHLTHLRIISVGKEGWSVNKEHSHWGVWAEKIDTLTPTIEQRAELHEVMIQKWIDLYTKRISGIESALHQLDYEVVDKHAKKVDQDVPSVFQLPAQYRE